MADTKHKMPTKSDAWIGVDLDGTLAYWDKDSDINEVGSLIPAMFSRVVVWLSEGKTVKIMTARVCPVQPNEDRDFVDRQRKLIEAWCEHVFGQVLEVTHEKDYRMTELWDDRAVAVERNTGRVLNRYFQ